MTLYDYVQSIKIEAQGQPFYALIMAAMRQADTDTLAALRGVFPGTYDELVARYNAPGGLLPNEQAQSSR